MNDTIVEAVAEAQSRDEDTKSVVLDLRNQRKIVMIDGQADFTSSQNLIKRNYFS